MIAVCTFSSLNRVYNKMILLSITCCILLILIVTNSNYSLIKTKIPTTLSKEERIPEFFKKLEFPESRVRFDNKRLIRIYDYVRVGSDWIYLQDDYDTCLATQASIEHLYWVPQLLENWLAPLSLATYIMDEREWLVFNLYCNYLEKCYPQLTRSVSIHVALPVNVSVENFALFWKERKARKWNVMELLSKSIEKPCGDFNDTKMYLQELLATFSIPTVWQKDELANKSVYPQNHLRNIARKTCPTKWTYSVDVDIIPREGMAAMLQMFYDDLASPKRKLSCYKCAFVVPTFDLDISASRVPLTKEEMVGHFKNKTATPLNLYWEPAQYATDHKRWTTTHLDETRTQISHDIILNRTKQFEPFYVSSDDIPAFDERFLGYGSTRSSQFQEAFLAGWKFKVLTPVFAIHWGIHKHNPKPETFAEEVRENQTVHNRHLFAKIFKEMQLKQEEGIL